MQKLRNVGLDAVLTVEQGLLIKQTAVEAARRVFVGRKLLNVFGPLGEGVVDYGYYTKTHGTGARIDYGWPGAESKDAVNLSRTTVGIPLIHQEFEINKLDLAASKMNMQPLNLSEVDSKSYQVAWQEDALIIQGWSKDGTNYEINGLYNAAGNSEASGLDYGTKANIETSVNNSMALMLADNILPPYNMVLHPTQFSQTNALIANTGISYKTWIESVIGGTLFSSPALTDGTGLMTAVRTEGVFEYVIAEDLTVDLEVLEKSKNLWGKIYIRGLPVVYDSNAICKLTSI